MLLYKNMSYFNPSCEHNTLIKSRYCYSNYNCMRCNKQFVIIPVKIEPINPPLIFPSEKNHTKKSLKISFKNK